MEILIGIISFVAIAWGARYQWRSWRRCTIRELLYGVTNGFGSLTVIRALSRWIGRTLWPFSLLRMDTFSDISWTGLAMRRLHLNLRDIESRDEQRVLKMIARVELPMKREAFRAMIGLSVAFYVWVGAATYTLLETVRLGGARGAAIDKTDLLALAAFCGLFVVKSYFAPVVLGLTIGWTVFFSYQTETLHLFPLFQWAIELALPSAPSVVGQAYLVSFTVYSAALMTWGAMDPSSSLDSP